MSGKYNDGDITENGIINTDYSNLMGSNTSSSCPWRLPSPSIVHSPTNRTESSTNNNIQQKNKNESNRKKKLLPNKNKKNKKKRKRPFMKTINKEGIVVIDITSNDDHIDVTNNDEYNINEPPKKKQKTNDLIAKCTCFMNNYRELQQKNIALNKENELLKSKEIRYKSQIKQLSQQNEALELELSHFRLSLIFFKCILFHILHLIKIILIKSDKVYNEKGFK